MRRHQFAAFACLAALTMLSGCSKQPDPGKPEAAPTERLTRPLNMEPVPPNTVGFSEAGIAALNAEMHRQVDAGSLAGIVHLLVRHGEVANFDAYGKKSIETGEPIAKEDIFRLYSQTKPVIAAAMMVLYEQGKWQLDDPVSRFAPELANLKVLAGTDAGGKPILENARRPPTMRELLSHTAGFGYGIGLDDYVDQQLFEKVWNNGSVRTMTYDQLLATIGGIPLNFQPGTDWRYSIASDIQGALIERISGETLPDFLDRHIFEPLGMKDTGFLITPEQAARMVSLYALGEKGELVELKPNAEYIFPLDHTKPAVPFNSGGGHLVSTAADFARFCQMLLNGGELAGKRVLTPSSVQMLITDQVPPNITPKTQEHYGGPDQSFTFGAGILRNPLNAGLKAPPGTVLWGGLGGTWFLLDKKNDLFFIGMVNRAAEVPKQDILPLRATNAIYEALEQRTE